MWSVTVIMCFFCVSFIVIVISFSPHAICCRFWRITMNINGRNATHNNETQRKKWIKMTKQQKLQGRWGGLYCKAVNITKIYKPSKRLPWHSSLVITLRYVKRISSSKLNTAIKNHWLDFKNSEQSSPSQAWEPWTTVLYRFLVRLL